MDQGGEAMGQRVCRRCLLRDMAGHEQLKRIEAYRDAIRPGDRAGEAEYERRLALCLACGQLLDGTCLACGCYVELRAAARVSRCPKKRW